MPSGAKKRKAAKKKKEIQSNNNTNSSSAVNHPHGDEDVKHHEDRESDVGENSSPTSQDHHNLPTREDEEEIPTEREFKIEDEEEIPIEREFKIEDELENGHGNGNGVRSKSPDSAPRASADTGAEHVKDSVVTQPLLAPPIPVQKTSWKSCCGLFELFSGSGE